MKNINKILITTILNLIIFVLLNLYIGHTNIGKAYAITLTTYAGFCSNDVGTYWTVSYEIFDGGITSVFGVRTGVTNTAQGASPCGTATGYFTALGNYWYNYPSTSTYRWGTACVDPVGQASYYNGTDAMAIENADVTCKKGLGGVYSKCDLGSTSNLGTVGSSCPLGGGGGGATPTPSIPSAPGPLSYNPYCNGPASIAQVSWQTSTGATYYEVKYSVPSQSYSSPVYTVNAPTTTKVIYSGCNTAPPGGCSFPYGVSVQWSVRACNTTGCSNWATGNNTSANCSGGGGGGTWSGLTANPSCSTTYTTVSQAQFSWGAFSGASSYNLHWATSSQNTGTATSWNVPYSQNPSCTTGPGGCSFSYGISVSWYVEALNSSGGVISTSPSQTFTTATCSSGNVSCQSCVNGTCQTTQVTPPCNTNCSACSGNQCMLPNKFIKLSTG